ncbi:hypothetical protein MMC12_003763 [Toensbergia leucococca]|nr:hypothetical protein [Toensbergia leucococca]
MTDIQPGLKWSAQLTTATKTPLLQGDKIVLPQSALEQLLSAATVTITESTSLQNHTSTFDPYNPYTHAAERQAREQLIERQQQLPHPLTFRLVNPEKNIVVYAGIREFSAQEHEIGLSPFLLQALGLGDDKALEGTGDEGRIREHDIPSGELHHQSLKPPTNITVHAQQLPKGTYVRLRPLEAGYDPEDWKSLLERYLRDNFTTLTNGEILTVPAGKDEFRFLVDKLSPEGEAICIVDTDLEVDIEALNEDQARETLKRRLQKSERAPGTIEGSSTGGKINVGNEDGQVRPRDYVDYTLTEWDHSKGLEIELATLDDENDADLFISPARPKQRARPREEEYVFGDMTSRPLKRIKIQHSNAELNDAEALWISVRGYSLNEETNPISYQLRVKSLDALTNLNGHDLLAAENEPTGPDEIRCKNCHQWVPQRTMILHENFCFRNNVLCPHCQNVFKKSSSEWQNHWHCPHDDVYGNIASTLQKHNNLIHTPRLCPGCDYSASNTPDLAHHRTTICPAKAILCQFCHLLVPQQGPNDLKLSDPEVILSGLTPHELADGARTTECHLCSKIVRLRDMSTHLKHHNLSRLSRSKPRLCRNLNCGRTLDYVSKTGDVKREPPRNDLGVCDTCFGPLYVSMYDPDGKALKRRVERKYLTQLLTGCGKEWCRNEYCKSGRRNLGLERGEKAISSKEALGLVRPLLEGLKGGETGVFLCTDEGSQRRRVLAEMVAAEGVYEVEWCVVAFEVAGGDLDGARTWLVNWAPTKAEANR